MSKRRNFSLKRFIGKESFSLSGFMEQNPSDIEAVYKCYYGRLFAKGMSITGDKEVTMDIIQNLFVKVCSPKWGATAKITCQEDLLGYLLVSVNNASLNQIRKEKITNRTHKEIAYISLGTGDDIERQPVEGILIKEEVKKRIHQIIETLPEKCREVFKLVKIDGLSRHEVASILGISVNSVNNHITRGNKLFDKKVRSHKLETYYFLLACVV